MRKEVEVEVEVVGVEAATAFGEDAGVSRSAARSSSSSRRATASSSRCAVARSSARHAAAVDAEGASPAGPGGGSRAEEEEEGGWVGEWSAVGCARASVGGRWEAGAGAGASEPSERSERSEPASLRALRQSSSSSSSSSSSWTFFGPWRSLASSSRRRARVSVDAAAVVVSDAAYRAPLSTAASATARASGDAALAARSGSPSAGGQPRELTHAPMTTRDDRARGEARRTRARGTEGALPPSGGRTREPTSEATNIRR